MFFYCKLFCVNFCLFFPGPFLFPRKFYIIFTLLDILTQTFCIHDHSLGWPIVHRPFVPWHFVSRYGVPGHYILTHFMEVLEGHLWIKERHLMAHAGVLKAYSWIWIQNLKAVSIKAVVSIFLQLSLIHRFIPKPWSFLTMEAMSLGAWSLKPNPASLASLKDTTL